MDPYLSIMDGNEVIHLTIVGPDRAVCLPLMVVRSATAAPRLELAAYRPADELRMIHLHEPIVPIGYGQNPRKPSARPSPKPVRLVIQGPEKPMLLH